MVESAYVSPSNLHHPYSRRTKGLSNFRQTLICLSNLWVVTVRYGSYVGALLDGTYANAVVVSRSHFIFLIKYKGHVLLIQPPTFPNVVPRSAVLWLAAQADAFAGELGRGQLGQLARSSGS